MDTAAAFREYHRAPSRELRDRLVEHYVPYARAIAARLKHFFPPYVELDELVQASLIALTASVERFDPERASSFENYVVYRIRGAIYDHMRDRDHLSRWQRAQVVGGSDEMPAAPLSFDTAGLTEDEPSLHDALGWEDASLEHVENEELVAQLLEPLSERERCVVVLYYFEGLRLHQIAELLGVTESRISQLLTKARWRMRTWLPQLLAPAGRAA